MDLLDVDNVNASFELKSKYAGSKQKNDVPSLYSNKSFTFDGVDDYVNCGNDSSLVPTTELSISAWFKTSATTRPIASKHIIELN